MTTLAPSPLPARVLHNERLYKATPLFPRVSEQVPTLPLNRRALQRFGYNPSIVHYQNRTLLAYRWHSAGTLATALVMADLDKNCNVTSNKPIQVEGQSAEDMHLFLRGDQLWASWVVSNWPSKEPKCVMRVGRLIENGDHWRAEPVIQPKYGQNDFTGMEKNWVFFEYQERLYFVYQSQKQIVVCADTMTVYSTQTRPKWMFGPIKGGTTPLPFKDNRWIRFFHSTLDNNMPPYRRRYFIGALLMESEPPFTITQILPRPIIYGSEADDLTDTERGSCPHFKANVVFEGGAIDNGEEYVVAIGVNDSQSVLARVNKSTLNFK